MKVRSRGWCPANGLLAACFSGADTEAARPAPRPAGDRGEDPWAGTRGAAAPIVR